jgi:predicted amidohydrolase YtcJ
MAVADCIITGGEVEPVVGDPAEAVAVRNGRVLAVGSTEEVMDHRRRDTEVVDLAGDALLPGLVEPHTHPDLCGQLYSWIDVSGFTHRSVEGVEKALREGIARTGPGEWVYAFGLDFMLTEGLGVWDRARLDAMAPDNPLAIMIQSMHTVFANSAALAACGIDESVEDPGSGGRYVRDGSGRLTGRVEELDAIWPLLVHGMPGPDLLAQQVADQYRRYAEVGITCVGMAGTFLGGGDFATYRDLAAGGDVPLRLVAYMRHEEALGSHLAPGHGDDEGLFSIAGVKLWYDGSPYTGTMLLDDPYLETELCCCTLGIEPGSVGRPNFDPADLREILGELHDAGWQVMTHAQGDRACRETLDLYAQVLADTPEGHSHGWRLEHCALITDEDLLRAARLGVSPSFHVDHVRWYGPELRDSIIGPQRADRLMPIRGAIDHGHRPSLHADSPMYPPGPLRLAGTAAGRRTRHGDVLGAAQAIPVEAAIRAITIDAAWQLGIDDDVGSIEVGKRADFVRLERNPMGATAHELEGIGVLGTWLGGKLV